MSHRRMVTPVVLTVQTATRRSWVLGGLAGLAVAMFVAVSGSLAGGFLGIVAGTLGYVGMLAALVVLVIQPARNRSASEWVTEVTCIRVERLGLVVRVASVQAGSDITRDVRVPWSNVTGCQIREGVYGASMLCFDVVPAFVPDCRDEFVRRILEESVARYRTPIAINLEATKYRSPHSVLSLNHTIRGMSDGRVHLRAAEPPRPADSEREAYGI